MKKFCFVLLAGLSLQSNLIYAQIVANPKTATIAVKKVPNAELVIPIEVEFVNPQSSDENAMISLEIDNTLAPVASQLDPSHLGFLTLINNIQPLLIPKFETKKLPNGVYLLIDKNLVIPYDRVISVRVKDRGRDLAKLRVLIQPDDSPLTVDNYLEENIARKDRIQRLDYVTKVESANNILTVYGYKKVKLHDGTEHEAFLKRMVELKSRKVLAITEKSSILSSVHWKPVPITLTIIPLKVRSKLTTNGKHFSGSANAGFTNIGLNLDLLKRQTDRYFATGKKSTHKWSLGVWAAPSVEELDSIFTFGANGALGKVPGKVEKSKQFFVSTGISLSYSYNDISFVIVPAGWDYATSSIGKTWVYNKKRWWGFGIAVSPKFFATIVNK